jgi:uncharacterized membrane protein YhhN
MPFLNRIVYGVFFCFAIFFILTINIRPFPFVYIIKVVPVLSLALLMFAEASGVKGRLIAMGLIFSGFGDAILELDRSNYFFYGLAVFLVAHLFYISAFFRKSRFHGHRAIIALVMILYCAVMEYLLFPNLGKMLIPVTVYLCVIMTMGLSATLGTTNSNIVIVGACLFIISDSIVAIDRFIVPVPFSSLWIMIGYYSAQFLIATGSIRHK